MKILLNCKLLLLVFGVSNAFASTEVVERGWTALEAGNTFIAHRVATQCIERNYTAALRLEEERCREAGVYRYRRYYPLSDEAECLFLEGKAFEAEGKDRSAIMVYQRLIDHFPSAMIDDVGGWRWCPADEARRIIKRLKRGCKLCD